MPTMRQAWFVDRSPGRGGIIISSVFSPAGGNAGGKFYAECQITAAFVTYSGVFGIGGSGLALRTQVGSDGFDNATAQPWMANGVFYSFNAADLTKGLGWGYPTRPITLSTAWQVGDWMGMAFDTINSQSWIRNATRNPTVWFGGTGAGTPNPVGAVQPNSFSGTSPTSPISGNIYLIGGVSQVGNSNASHAIVTLNAGATAFVAAAPSGYSVFDATAIWNSSDAGAEITISGAGLICSNTAQITGPNQPYELVRSTISKLRA